MFAPSTGLRPGSILLAVWLLVSLEAPRVTAQTTPLWRYEAAAEIKWVSVAPNDFRQNETLHMVDFFYGLTSVDSAGKPRISIVKVSKDQNQIVGRVWATDSTSAYDLDGKGSTAFVITAPRVLMALKF